MIKLRIFNMKEFLHTVNQCAGPVNLLYPDGRKENINKQYQVQSDLQEKHREYHRCLPLSLEIPNPRDYQQIVFYAIGDC